MAMAAAIPHPGTRGVRQLNERQVQEEKGMKRSSLFSICLLSALLFPCLAIGNAIYYRSPGFDIPNGRIAFMGCYYSPLRVHANGLDDQFLIPKRKEIFGMNMEEPYFTPEKIQAVNETNQGLQDVISETGLTMDPVPFNEAYQRALLMHIFSPEKYLYNPGIAKFCGNRPFALIVVIDYYADFSSSINIRESQNGQKINYLNRRSIIEKDESVFKNKGRQRAAALELFLVSTLDGRTLWQCNTISTDNGYGSGYDIIAKSLIGSAFNNMMKR
jgi:hypothetical protein